MVGAKAVTALAALDEGVGEAREVARGLPHGGVHHDGGIQPDDVLSASDDVAPPGLLDVALELDAHGAVVPGVGEAAVDLAAGKDEAAALAQRDNLFHGHGTGGVRHRYLRGV